MKLTRSEEQIMKYLWKLKRAYMKDIIMLLPEPKPASTTIATLIKRMTDKGFVGYEQHGNNRLYYPLVKKTEYFSKHLNSVIKDFFNNSASQFASFFTNETKLSLEELEELKKIVEQQIEEKKK